MVDPFAELDPKRLPRHIAVIMDGNRRWAQARHLPRGAGHRVGSVTLRELVKSCIILGIPYLTAFAFSTENWRRSSDEVKLLWRLFRDALDREIHQLHQAGVRVRFIGEIQELAPELQKRIDSAQTLTQNNSVLTLVVALNYGGRREIVSAAQRLAQDVQAGTLLANEIDESRFDKYLYTSEIPDPDLLIRTSGEFRISNYLLWQLAYTEIFVTETFWPDFGPPDLRAALLSYQGRNRRFGSLLGSSRQSPSSPSGGGRVGVRIP